MTLIFMGTMAFAVPILEGLAKTTEILMVITQPDRPAGRKKELKPSPVKQCALALGLPLFQPESIKSEAAQVLALKPDLVVVAAYGQMIPRSLLEIPPYKAINVHASLLPKYRGGSPMQWAIYEGKTKTGVTIMQMAPKMDSGPILAQQELPIDPLDDVASLERKLGLLGKDLLLKTLPRWCDGTLKPTPQDDSQVTFANNLTAKMEKLDFRRSAKQVSDHIRALSPAPIAYGLIDGIKLKIHEASWESFPDQGQLQPGRIREVTKERVTVETSEGLVKLVKVQLPGKSPLLIRDFLNGSGKNLLVPGKFFI